MKNGKECIDQTQVLAVDYYIKEAKCWTATVRCPPCPDQTKSFMRVGKACGPVQRIWVEIVVGNFNFTDDNPVYRAAWRGLDNLSATAGKGFSYTKTFRWLGLRIDHVLTGPWLPNSSGPGRQRSFPSSPTHPAAKRHASYSGIDIPKTLESHWSRDGAGLGSKLQSY
jgi:hypothetical protein